MAGVPIKMSFKPGQLLTTVPINATPAMPTRWPVTTNVDITIDAPHNVSPYLCVEVGEVTADNIDVTKSHLTVTAHHYEYPSDALSHSQCVAIELCIDKELRIDKPFSMARKVWINPEVVLCDEVMRFLLQRKYYVGIQVYQIIVVMSSDGDAVHAYNPGTVLVLDDV